MLLFITISNLSCEKDDIKVLTISGVVKNFASSEPVANVKISIDAIKSPPAGSKIGGRRKNIAETITDSKGNYKVRLRLFSGAERLEITLNPTREKKGFVKAEHTIYLNQGENPDHINLDLKLTATSLLRIAFKNTQPFSDSDFFYLGWSANTNGWTNGIVKQETCGTVIQSEALTWTGKDVCGATTVETLAGGTTKLLWYVTKNGIRSEHRDSVFVKGGPGVTEYQINY